mmetsp:Transcript_146896/g.366365  ORF Transcript_146896/g.366365 Transcript_146896/m.366365 type:complete len:87 (-) Transcript_146896:3-263(-)
MSAAGADFGNSFQVEQPLPFQRMIGGRLPDSSPSFQRRSEIAPEFPEEIGGIPESVGDIPDSVGAHLLTKITNRSFAAQLARRTHS